MKPSIPRGTRDFGPAEMHRRNYILDIVRRNFVLFGFEPIETPAMENIGTLTGKYGEEGDQLIFKILNSRIHESKSKEALSEEFNLHLASSRNSAALTEKALRYDLTVPFARFVVMNQHQLVFPFKRYQVQPVWRADRPQKGRYREFYQCDADVIGSDSLVNEVELMSLMDKIFHELRIPVLIKFNNRKILSALATVLGEPERIVDITVAIDKLDKVGREGVEQELTNKGISFAAIEKLRPLLEFTGSNQEKVKVLSDLVGETVSGKKGLEEIAYLLENHSASNSEIQLDLTLARGLNYYTGTIFEVKANAGTFTPSISGGGRYDDLTGIFGLPGMSGVGISLGIDRIYDVMEELMLFPAEVGKISTTRVLFTHFDPETQNFCLRLATQLRAAGISCEVYPDANRKLGRQFDFANKKAIPFVCVVGSSELTSGLYSVKNMITGEQQQMNITEMIQYFK